MSDLYLDVQVKAYGGSNIPEVIKQMVALADRIGITVWAELNDVRTLARPGDDAERIWRAWEEASGSKMPYKMASDRGDGA